MECSEQLRTTLRNPHLWIVLALSAVLLCLYQGWPWREWQFTEGVWRLFSWLTALNFLVVNVELKFQVFGVLFFIPIIYASLTMSWAGGLLAYLLSLIWVYPTLAASWGGTRMITCLLLLFLPVLIVAAVNTERRWRESEKRNFAEREQERQVYIARLVETQEAERRRIAQELHDETLQTLMAIANKSDSLATSSADDRQIAGNQWIKQEILQTAGDLRRISMNLRPSILDNFGLVSGIRWLVNSNNKGGLHLSISITGEEHQMSSLAEVNLFRIAQEAIHNIQRHARAKTGRIALEFTEGVVTLEVTDDGTGFLPPERYASYVSKNKLGIIGIEQRVLSVGGSMLLESAPGKGTRLRVTIPYFVSDDILQGENT
jgi:signal transduction histidine kinase